ncbi:hypothetical protein [Afipia felis]
MSFAVAGLVANAKTAAEAAAIKVFLKIEMLAMAITRCLTKQDIA